MTDMVSIHDVISNMEYNGEVDSLTYGPAYRPSPLSEEVDELLGRRAKKEFISDYDRMKNRVAELESENQSLIEQRDRAVEGVETRERRIEALRNLQARRLHDITIAAHEQAQEKEYCSEFDRFMQECGLEPRHFTRRIQVKRVTTQYGYLDVEFTAGQDEDWTDLCDEMLSNNEEEIEWNDARQDDEPEIEDYHWGSPEFKELPPFGE